MKKPNKSSLLLSIAITAYFLSGCSFTPYKDDFTCTKGAGEGACDSVSNVYLGTLQKNSNIAQEVKKTQLEDVVDMKAIEESCEYWFFFSDDECLAQKYKEYVMVMEENEHALNELVYYQHLRNEKNKLDTEKRKITK